MVCQLVWEIKKDSEGSQKEGIPKKDILQRRTFWLYKGIGMLKLGRMHRQTGEKFVDLTAMSRQMREVSDF